MKIEFSNKVSENLKRKQVLAGGGGGDDGDYDPIDWSSSVRGNSSLNEELKMRQSNNNMEYKSKTFEEGSTSRAIHKYESFDEERRCLDNYSSFDEERRCQQSHNQGCSEGGYSNKSEREMYSPIQFDINTNAKPSGLLSPRVKLRRGNSILITPDRKKSMVVYEATPSSAPTYHDPYYSSMVTPNRYNNELHIGPTLSYPPRIDQSMSCESYHNWPLGNQVCYSADCNDYQQRESSIPPLSCPFSPSANPNKSSKSCFRPVAVAKKPSFSMPQGNTSSTAIFRRQSSLATSDTSWNDLSKVASVDEDDANSCASQGSFFDYPTRYDTNNNGSREDIDCPHNLDKKHNAPPAHASFSFSNEQQFQPPPQPITYSMRQNFVDHNNHIQHNQLSSSTMPLPYYDANTFASISNNKKESLTEEAFNCPISSDTADIQTIKQKNKKIVSVLCTSLSSSSSQDYNTNGVFNWSKEDDQTLIILMKRRRGPVKDWNLIARDHQRGKTGKNCNERWTRYLKPGVRKGQWKPDEDSIVFKAVTTSTELPFTKWSELSAKLPGRAGKQIRDRWINYLNPSIHHLPFTREDDNKLYNGHANLGKRWAEISLKYFHSTRSENQIKNRWYSASFKKIVSNRYGPNAYDAHTTITSTPTCSSNVSTEK